MFVFSSVSLSSLSAVDDVLKSAP